MIRYLTDAAGKRMTIRDVGNGVIMPRGFEETTVEQAKAYFEAIPNFQCRHDDIMLLNWPKTGTNWCYEILAMLLQKSPEYHKLSKKMTMLEFLPQEKVDTVPSPRVLNTHVAFRYLPRDMKEKQTKAVLLVRNPKDTVVSLYNHVKGFKEHEYDGEWKDFLQLYIEGGEMTYGLYSDYIKEFEQAVNEDNVGFPLHIVHYEDLKQANQVYPVQTAPTTELSDLGKLFLQKAIKSSLGLHELTMFQQNGVEELKKLARFLDVDIDDDTVTDINRQCSFDTMSKGKPLSEDLKKQFTHGGYNVYRKGQIGDWKNWFTVAQSEQFDAYWEKQMTDSKLKFTYSPNTESR